MLDNSLADRFAQRFVDSPELTGRVFRVFRIDRLSHFFDQRSQFRSRFDIARPSLQALLMSFDNRRVNCQVIPPKFVVQNFVASAVTRVNAKSCETETFKVFAGFYEIFM